MNAQISFPVLLFSKNELSMMPDEDHLTRCNKDVLEKGYYDESFVVDSAGRRYAISEVKQVGYVKPWKGWPWYSSRQIRINIKFGEIRLLTLEDLQQLVCQIIDRDADFWSSSGDPEELKNEVKGFRSFKEIMAFLA